MSWTDNLKDHHELGFSRIGLYAECPPAFRMAMEQAILDRSIGGKEFGADGTRLHQAAEEDDEVDEDESKEEKALRLKAEEERAIETFKEVVVDLLGGEPEDVKTELRLPLLGPDGKPVSFGTIDRIARTGDRAVVADMKTHFHSSLADEIPYKVQVLCGAAAALQDDPTLRAVLPVVIFPRTGELWKAPVLDQSNVAKFAASMARVVNEARALNEGPEFDTSRFKVGGHCAHCAGVGRCPKMGERRAQLPVIHDGSEAPGLVYHVAEQEWEIVDSLAAARTFRDLKSVKKAAEEAIRIYTRAVRAAAGGAEKWSDGVLVLKGAKSSSSWADRDRAADLVDKEFLVELGKRKFSPAMIRKEKERELQKSGMKGKAVEAAANAWLEETFPGLVQYGRTAPYLDVKLED